MFDHLSLGVRELSASLLFYDAVLGPLGIQRLFVMGDRGIAAYRDASGASFWLYAKNDDLSPLTAVHPSPRFHLAFQAASRSAVDAFYQAAIAQGGRDAGGPGLRSHYHPNYYAAYVLDLDGYKIEAVCHK